MSMKIYARSTCLLLLVLFAAMSMASAAEPLAGGTFTKKSFAISGSWSIVEEGGTRFLVLSDDFKTKKAPDLKLYLSGRDLSAADGGNATNGAILIAELDSPSGGQRYAIPAGVDLSEHGTLLLHCVKYSKLWGGATIR